MPYNITKPSDILYYQISKRLMFLSPLMRLLQPFLTKHKNFRLKTDVAPSSVRTSTFALLSDFQHQPDMERLLASYYVRLFCTNNL